MPPPSEELRASLGKMAIVSVLSAPEVLADGPIGTLGEATQGAATGALQGAGIVLAAALHPGNWVLLPLAPIGFVAGGIAGGTNAAQEAIPTQTAQAIESTIRSVIGKRELQVDLRSRVAKRVIADTTATIVDLGTPGTAHLSATPDYGALAVLGIATVLEVGLQAVALAGHGGSDPILAVRLVTHARLIQTADSRVVWSDDHVAYTSQARAYSEWAAHEAMLLDTEVERGLDVIAQQITDKAFLEIWSDGGKSP